MIIERNKKQAFCPECKKSMVRGVNWYTAGEPRILVWFCVNKVCVDGKENRSNQENPSISAEGAF